MVQQPPPRAAAGSQDASSSTSTSSKGCWPRGAAAGGSGPQQQPSASGMAAAAPHSSPWGRAVDRIASRLAFFPPSPPSYTVEAHRDGSNELYVQPVDRSHPRVTSARVRWVETAQGSRILTAFLPHLDGRGNRAPLTLLYSHGNAVDLGQMLPVFRELVRLLKVNVMGYDYTGYGASSGAPGIAASCCDIAAVLAALKELHGEPRHRVVLYGQSVGSGPSCWLAAQRPGVAGVVLHSPLLSGVRVFSPNLAWWPSWADIFPNHLLVKRVNVPLLVLHGTADDVIAVSAGQRLAELAPAAVPPLIAEGHGHQDLEASPDYLPRMKEFLTMVEKQQQQQQQQQQQHGGGAAGGGGSARR